MRTDRKTGVVRRRYVVLLQLLASATLMSGCASEPKPRPTALDPTNPAAPESLPLRVPSLGEGSSLRTPAETEPASTPAHGNAGDGRTQEHGGHAHGGGEANPPRSGSESKAGGPATVLYTCPMHPEVTSSEPGRCPKCGMKVVPKAPTEAPQGEKRNNGNRKGEK